MKNKILVILINILIILMLFINLQRAKIKSLLEKNKLLELQIKSVLRQNKDNLLDLQKRNEELKTKNDEIIELYKITENVSKVSDKNDCINNSISNNIKLLLQQAGI